MTQLTHIDESGAARMVDVGNKAVTERIAVASAIVSMQGETLALLEQGAHKKGDVLAVARIAGIQAAKKCSDLIPLCHPLMLNSVEISFHIDSQADHDGRIGGPGNGREAGACFQPVVPERHRAQGLEGGAQILQHHMNHALHQASFDGRVGAAFNTHGGGAAPATQQDVHDRINQG